MTEILTCWCPSGHIYVAGGYNDSGGQLLWAQQWQANNYSCYGVGADSAGNLFVSGCFANTLTLGTNLLAGSDAYTTFLAKLDANGEILWARAEGGFRWSHACEVATDAAGNAYISSDFSGVVTFGPHALVAYGDDDFFIVKYDADGRPVWARKASAEPGGPGNALSVDQAGNIYRAGTFNTPARFGSHTLLPSASPNLYLAKLTQLETLYRDTSPSCLRLSNGTFRLQFLGLRGRSPIVFEASTNLLRWEPVCTNTAPIEPVEFSVPLQPGEPARFFRARLRQQP